MKIKIILTLIICIIFPSWCYAHCPSFVKEEKICLMLDNNTLYIYDSKLEHNGPYKDFVKTEINSIKTLDNQKLIFKKIARGIYKFEAKNNEKNVILEVTFEKRKKEIAPFEDKVNKLLNQVGMPNAKIKVDITDVSSLNLFGNDTIEFLFNANLSAIQTAKSAKFEPLRKVASGGELSRVMLSIKSLVARSVQLPTLIFDEIDSGISGEAARQVGIIIKELSAAHQVISITHQPQIAAKAERHFFVYKEIKNDTIITAIKTLNDEERVTAIATMLSGKKPTAAAFENAKELIRN